ncbi:hypothetical protein OIU85_001817 [Salix viminalis]|uniref:DYW domain-containing protein n=1 Tax=Salix viminalis TaxID=40686 RepID=A0A9Q0VMK7_SALVM|nr:hypothetical protein OIU85_001817 [Salix viminalis]KAJ6751322.1 hypothetical protein OIU85_001817 [Salix viminalis]
MPCSNQPPLPPKPQPPPPPSPSLQNLENPLPPPPPPSSNAPLPSPNPPEATTTISKTSKNKPKSSLSALFIPPTPLTEAHIISLIHGSKTVLQLHQIHAQIIIHNLSSSSLITTQLISSSSLRKSINHSLAVFNHHQPKNLFTFNALIRGLTTNSHFFNAIFHFKLMLRSGIKPDRLTYPFVLKSMAGLFLKELGMTIHCMVLRCGIEFDSFVRVSLADMYVKVEKLGSAFKVFDESPERFDSGSSALLWNVLIKGCCKAGSMKKAVKLFKAMPMKENVSWSTLIDGFAKNGDMDRAMELFDQMPEKNVVSWTTMVDGFSRNGDCEKALSMFFKMLGEGVKPNAFTVVSALSACAKIGALEAGLRIHKYIKDNGLHLTEALGTALVDMYAKCGDIESASEVFGKTKQKSILTWTVMIWGWAIHGHSEQAIACFKQMMFAGIKPDEVVFLALLTACMHSGQVDIGLNFFDSMRLDYCIEPSMKHYTLIVDMLGRSGQLTEALRFIERMPVNPDFVIWGALFCACRAHKKTKMAKFALKKLRELEPTHTGNYVFLSNAYAALGQWEDAERVRVLMQNRGFHKNSGWSFIEVEGQVHRFVSGDHDHKDAKAICLKLEEIKAGAVKQGCIPGTEWVLHNMEQEEKEDVLGIHGEKLALAFALICTPPRMTIRIVKNLLVCGDCHSLMKYASKMSQREIILRDMKRFHLFKDGSCSCGDHW